MALKFVVRFSRLPGLPTDAIPSFVAGIVTAAVGYLLVVIANYPRYRVEPTEFC